MTTFRVSAHDQVSDCVVDTNSDLGGVSFGEQLRALRERAGMTQETLAERAGLSRDAISALERGRRSRPHPPTLAAISDALELSLHDRATLRRLAQPSRLPTLNSVAQVRSTPNVAIPIGRAAEIEQIGSLLGDPMVRLVTLTGAGGVGKTRLAAEFAQRPPARFAGTIEVALSAVWESDLILPGVLQAIGVRVPGDQPSALDLQRAIGEGPYLLILDNLEHLGGAAHVVSALLRDVPQVTILATSRSPLRIRVEREFPVRPLDAILAGAAEDGNTRMTDAMRLFIERARMVQPAFQVSAANAAAVDAICRRLDGLPLALELAAARIKVLAPQTLLERLERSPELLTGGPRDQVPRLQSIHAAIAWSYDLLDTDEQAAFRALAVFVDGFTLEAAETVLQQSLGLDADDVLDVVSSLIDKSLIVLTTNPGAVSRYSMLFTVRGFASMELERSETAEAVHRAFIGWVQETALRGADTYRHGSSSDQYTWIARMERERGNWRAALSWLHEHGPAEDLERLVTNLSGFWYVRGPIPEGRFWFARAIAPEGTTPPDVHLAALMTKGIVDHYGGHDAEAITTLERGLAMEIDPPQHWWRGNCHMMLGITRTGLGEYARARAHFAEGISEYQYLPHPINIAMCTFYLGVIAWCDGDPHEGIPLCESGLATLREHGSPWGMADGLAYLGLMACEIGEYPLAIRSISEALEQRVEISHVQIRATDHHPASMRWEAGSWDDIGRSMAEIAVLCEALERPHDAAEMLGAARAIWERVRRTEPNLPERNVILAAESRLRTNLGEGAFQVACSVGFDRNPDQALASARYVLSQLGADVSFRPATVGIPEESHGQVR